MIGFHGEHRADVVSRIIGFRLGAGRGGIRPSGERSGGIGHHALVISGYGVVAGIRHRAAVGIELGEADCE